ncbi:hypothetical protein HXZ88_17645 [Myroides odoratimimus]|uniref:hypothetical protein n=1 Tax=Myroides odoratimimus TaxID=76832 RepID=UPI002578684A|nr:hypothetical protein [Myroides odoratimimus]MDM1067406.1 hypothetical protein [Myroides odoratimimus]
MNKRIRKNKRLEQGFRKFKQDVRKLYPKTKSFKNISFYMFKQMRYLYEKPKYPETIRYFLDKEKSFSDTDICFSSNIFEVPTIFSIRDNYNETCLFLKKFINSLHKQAFKDIYIDYKKCNEIDICASMCMDIILAEFIDYFEKMLKDRHTIKIDFIRPINYEKHSIEKKLFSIGAYKTIKGFTKSYNNIEPFEIRIGNKDNNKIDEVREVHTTETVDYLINCLKKLNRTLTPTAETNFYRVIGEVIQNAEEHSNTKYRYLIGYFEQSIDEHDNYGIFNLAILNFGNTFYETFKDAENPNKETLKAMKNLSDKYTTKGLFKTKQFEEETLWTLYALQDGVTRMIDWQRGNGAIRFIESFLDLKGKIESDDISKMVINSGHSHLIFDGFYKTVEMKRGEENFKMMTFNTSGDIEELPDDKYVKFEENYFPGTIISVKLKLDYENTEKIDL